MDIEIHSIQAGFGVAHLLEMESGLYLVDAGSPRSERKIIDCMKLLGREDLRLIFLTHAHFDHFGCAAQLRRLTGAPIAIHKFDAGYLAKGETLLGRVRGRGKIPQPGPVRPGTLPGSIRLNPHLLIFNLRMDKTS